MATSIDFSIFDDEKTLDFIATVNADNSPHITVFSSVMKYDERTLMFGEYCRGVSKSNLTRNRKAAIFALSSDKRFVRGRLQWREKRNAGPEHELFNNIPRFRYNATYGYEWVHLLAIEELEGPFPFPAAEEANAAIARTAEIVSAYPARNEKKALSYAMRSLLEPANAVKLLAYVAEDGYPRLIYAPQAQPAGSDALVLAADFSGNDLKKIPDKAEVSLFSFVPKLASSILVKGPLTREVAGGAEISRLDITRIYNGNTPKAGYVFPLEPVETIRRFAGAADV